MELRRLRGVGGQFCLEDLTFTKDLLLEHQFLGLGGFDKPLELRSGISVGINRRLCDHGLLEVRSVSVVARFCSAFNASISAVAGRANSSAFSRRLVSLDNRFSMVFDRPAIHVRRLQSRPKLPDVGRSIESLRGPSGDRRSDLLDGLRLVEPVSENLVVRARTLNDRPYQDLRHRRELGSRHVKATGSGRSGSLLNDVSQGVFANTRKRSLWSEGSTDGR
ncbi:hypothetical protein PC110_g14936 [Phytophthora cactorum]|uniref:Uncharacterized protein n=1 Tax=Phytophthora cactorum TaxID=29920 RepID=A0A329RZK7_9STRA|nr:hypothetical protein PC120_g20372 [Phytophthora cactorum]KAG4057948.1 hypothetical protein PC123_g7071 [Phytophthora cactorum]RAW28688.1 hypothetical protein PC110_g14936 [Phytophthora cactorum]